MAKMNQNNPSDFQAKLMQENTAHMQNILQQMINMLNKELRGVSDNSIQHAQRVKKSIAKLEDDLSEHRIDLYTSEEGVRLKAAEAFNTYQKNKLKEANAETRALIYLNQASELEAFQETYKKKQLAAAEYAREEARIRAELEEDLDKESRKLLEKRLAETQSNKNKAETYLDNHKDKYSSSGKMILENYQNAGDMAAGSQDTRLLNSVAKDLRDAAKSQSITADEAYELNQQANALDREARVQEAKEKNAAIKAELKYRLTTLNGIKKTIEDGFIKGVGLLSKAFDSLEKPINSFYEYQAKYEARMQGSENEYGKMLANIGKSVGLSPFMSQQRMVEHLQKLIDSGTNYNLELRAYIATVSENIANTFDAFDSNLMRLIRIQQSDSTAARLGMEAALTQILNSRFSDSSYLNGTSDTVSGYLLDASAQLSHEAAAEVEFIVQKWLGALYSLGVSDQSISNIAQGIGYLGSGNTEALAGNDQLMTLLAMSASRSGASISDFLTGTLTAENTNKLLKGMVELLGDIADNTDSNKVTKAAFANVFGITNTDLRSISNLTQSDIDYLSGTNLNYSQALLESSSQLKNISSRMHISSMISNLIDNATTSSALMIGSTAPSYALYKALNVVSGLVGDRGMEIPGLLALGTGTASGIDVLSIAKAAMAGGGLLTSLVGALGNLDSGGLPAFSDWNGYEQSLARGEGFNLNKTAGITSGVTESVQYTSNQSTQDFTKASMQSAKESAVENMSESDKEAQKEAQEYQTVMRSNLQTITDLLVSLVDTTRDNSLRVFISNEDLFNGKPVDVNLTNLSDTAATNFRNALALLLAGNLADNQPENATISLVDLLKTALNDVNVRITNDYFDDYYQKQAYQLGGNI